MNTSKLLPYLNFNGTCEEAMSFYQSVMGGDLEITRFGDMASPEMPVSETYKNKVMHSSLTSEPLTLMASDGQEGREIVFGDSVSICITGSDEATLTKYFNGLSEGGTITMPLAKQMWGSMFGMFTDKFGIQWLVDIGSASPTA